MNKITIKDIQDAVEKEFNNTPFTAFITSYINEEEGIESYKIHVDGKVMITGRGGIKMLNEALKKLIHGNERTNNDGSEDPR